MEIHYRTTVDDYVAFNLYISRRSTAIRACYWFGLIAVPLIFALIVAVILAKGPSDFNHAMWIAGIAFVGMVLGAGVYVFLYQYFLSIIIASYAKEFGTRGVIGQITLILDDETLTEITETTRSVVRWESMDRVDEVGDYTFIMVTGVTAAIVPRHGFSNEADYFRVRDFAMARIRRAS